MNYRLINLQKTSLALAQIYAFDHPIRVKIREEIARVRAASEEPYLRAVKPNLPPKK